MATIPIGADQTLATPRAVRRGFRVLREAPLIPLAILAVLAFVAILAPILAPHSKLDPVKPTREQCQAKYGMPDCPYIDNVPPFWSRGGRVDTPLGTQIHGRHVLIRLMYGAPI
jgi:ABC-type dipeptide/oligopeptide/nickel transport system permease subunit